MKFNIGDLVKHKSGIIGIITAEKNWVKGNTFVYKIYWIPTKPIEYFLGYLRLPDRSNKSNNYWPSADLTRLS